MGDPPERDRSRLGRKVVTVRKIDLRALRYLLFWPGAQQIWSKPNSFVAMVEPGHGFAVRSASLPFDLSTPAVPAMGIAEAGFAGQQASKARTVVSVGLRPYADSYSCDPSWTSGANQVGLPCLRIGKKSAIPRNFKCCSPVRRTLRPSSRL